MVGIEHVAVWSEDIERLKAFYETYFGAEAGPKYVNAEKRFESYFLRFSFGARLELMHVPSLSADVNRQALFLGYAHLAFSVGSQDQVDRLTARLQSDGYRVIGHPRHTGDGYYESVVLDPDGNRVEITV